MRKERIKVNSFLSVFCNGGKMFLTFGEQIAYWMKNPHLLYRKPFHVIENIYYVGNDWTAAYLLDTKEGLILIGATMSQTADMLIDSIKSSGFDPKNIRRLLITHAHYDQCGGAKAIHDLSGCEIWLGKHDEFFFTQRRDMIMFEKTVPDFPITNFYDYDSVIDCGDIQIRPLHCPGHTPGTTSFFFDIQHKGRVLTCGHHGGIGSSFLARDVMARSGIPLSLRDNYLISIEKVRDIHVDVVLPQYPGKFKGFDFWKAAESDDGSGDNFIDSQAWGKMLDSKQKAILEIMLKEEGF